MVGEMPSAETPHVVASAEIPAEVIFRIETITIILVILLVARSQWPKAQIPVYRCFRREALSLVASIGDGNVIKILCIFAAIFALAFLDLNGSQKAVPASAPVATGLQQAAPAKASTAAPLCTVDMEKFLNIKEGMSRSQIERDIGCPGEVLSSGSAGKFQTVLLSWKGNSPSSKMRAVFRNDTLISKAQLGLK